MHDRSFRAPAARIRWFSDVILSSIPDPAAPVRVLDIGCGTGDQIFDLLDRMPTARFVGIDVSATNIALAEERRATRTDLDRIAFHATDVRDFTSDARFDVVLSYSVLYLIPGGADALAQRISELVAPRGLFINAMPCRGPYNQALVTVRRLLRLARSPLTDSLLFSIARLVHGASIDKDLLAERIPYAYVLPLQYEDDVAHAAEQCGLRTLRHGAVSHASLAQMKHAFRIMRRETVGKAGG